MTMADLATWSQLLSSLAVLITLVYLAIEVKQNTEALHSQTRQSLLAGGQAELFMWTGHPELFINCLKPDALVTEEYVQLHAYLCAVMRAREYAWLQYQKGIIDKDQWQTEQMVIIVTMTPKRNKLWWDKIGRNLFNPQFVKFIDKILVESTDPGTMQIALNWEST